MGGSKYEGQCATIKTKKSECYKANKLKQNNSNVPNLLTVYEAR